MPVNPLPPLITNYIYELDPAAVDDFNGLLTSPITVTLQTPWLYFQDPNSRKDFNEIEVMTPDAGMTLDLDAASNSDEFTTPTNVVNGLPLALSPFGDRKFYLAGYPTKDRYYRLTFRSSGAFRTMIDALRFELIAEHRI